MLQNEMSTSTAATAIATPRVFLKNFHRNSHHDFYPALFGRSMFDALQVQTSSTSAASEENYVSSSKRIRHYEQSLVTLEETMKTDKDISPSVLLSPAGALSSLASTSTSSSCIPTPSNSWTIPIARAAEELSFLSTICPTVYLAKTEWYTKKHKDSPQLKPYVSLSAVAIIRDRNHRILLTRRASHMRSFPSAWVMPGGGIDEGESILEGVVREVKEETGLVVKEEKVEVFALWESCFPMNGRDCVEMGTGIKAHHLVVFCLVDYNENERECDDGNQVVLQPEEADLAVWLSERDFRRMQKHIVGEVDIGIVDAAASTNAGAPSSSSSMSSSGMHVALEELCGIYPRGSDNCGIAQGNLFALEKIFLELNSKSKE